MTWAYRCLWCSELVQRDAFVDHVATHRAKAGPSVVASFLRVDLGRCKPFEPLGLHVFGDDSETCDCGQYPKTATETNGEVT